MTPPVTDPTATEARLRRAVGHLRRLALAAELLLDPGAQQHTRDPFELRQSLERELWKRAREAEAVISEIGAGAS